jgi:hypothetical protein
MSPTPSLDPDGNLTVPPSKGAGRVTTLRGVVSEGVEAGCVILTSGGVVYELRGAPVRRLKSGQRVEVEGRVETEMLSVCQQGTIFTVTAVRSG